MWRQLKSGAWLNRERLARYPVILLVVSLAAAVIWVALSDGLIDRNGKPIGTDFSNVWAAGRLVLQGDPAAPYDVARQIAAEAYAFQGRSTAFFGWHYPPVFLFVAAGLALLPYGWALVLWTALTLPAYLAALRAILSRRETVLIALAFPAVFVNLGHGQNGFLTAALLGGALAVLDYRPLLTGFLIGLLSYKPQFGLLVPVALLASGCWRAVTAATVTVLGTVVATLLTFGPRVWQAFAEFSSFTRLIVLEEGNIGWAKIQSLFSAVRMLGGVVEEAYAAQVALALALAASLVWLWRSSASYDLKAAALACGSLLATPYVLDYDFVVLAVSIAFFARHGLAHGFRDYEISVLALCWIMPLFARSMAASLGAPVGILSMLALYAVTLRRAATDIAAQVQTSTRLAPA